MIVMVGGAAPSSEGGRSMLPDIWQIGQRRHGLVKPAVPIYPRVATGSDYDRRVQAQLSFLRALRSNLRSALRCSHDRVDMHGSAVHEMRRLFEVHRVHGAYAESRDLRPAETPSMVVFEAEALRHAGVFASRPSCYR